MFAFEVDAGGTASQRFNFGPLQKGSWIEEISLAVIDQAAAGELAIRVVLRPSPAKVQGDLAGGRSLVGGPLGATGLPAQASVYANLLSHTITGEMINLPIRERSGEGETWLVVEVEELQSATISGTLAVKICAPTS